MFRARDAMTSEIVTLKSQTLVEEAMRTLLRCKISGAPVIDDDGKLIGIISEFQLLAVLYDGKCKQAPVEQFMSRDVITVGPDTPLERVADLFVLHRIRRVPVVEDDRVIGILSRRDLLAFALGEGDDALEKCFCLLADDGKPHTVSSQEPADHDAVDVARQFGILGEGDDDPDTQPAALGAVADESPSA